MAEESGVKAPIWMMDTKWRETGRQIKVGPFDGRLMIFFLLLVFFPSMIVLGIAVSALLFFYVLEYFGYTLPNAYRKIFVTISGKRKNGVHYWRQNKFRN